MSSRMRVLRRLLLGALLALFVLAPIELMSFGASRILVAQGLMRSLPDPSGYSEYLAVRDPVVGWPSSVALEGGEFDSSGSRFVPAYPDPNAQTCAAVIGDSFTWGDEVSPEHAYGNVLAMKLGCRVANYGIGGYGTDQAVLRYLERTSDQSPLVILGIYSENIVRVVNQNRDLLAGSKFGLKPRFVLGESNQLQLVPLPELTEQEYVNTFKMGSPPLAHEYFRAGSRYAAPIADFPYTVSIVELFLSHRVQSRIRREVPYAEFFEPSHDSQALQVMLEITVLFLERLRAREQQGLIVLIPDKRDLQAIARGDAPTYVTLKEELERRGHAGPDVAAGMLAELGGRDVCDLFVSCSGSSHFNEYGYSILAQYVAAWVVDNGLLKRD